MTKYIQNETYFIEKIDDDMVLVFNAEKKIYHVFNRIAYEILVMCTMFEPAIIAENILNTYELTDEDKNHLMDDINSTIDEMIVLNIIEEE